MLCQPILKNGAVVCVLQAINKKIRVDHATSDMNYHDRNMGFTAHDQFLLSVIGLLGHSTLVTCESKQSDLFAVKRTQTLLDASFDLQDVTAPADVMAKIMTHMKELFKAMNLQLWVITRKEGSNFEFQRYTALEGRVPGRSSFNMQDYASRPEEPAEGDAPRGSALSRASARGIASTTAAFSRAQLDGFDSTAVEGSSRRNGHGAPSTK